MKKYLFKISMFCLFGAIFSSCTETTQFNSWQDEDFGKVAITESVTRTFTIGNPSADSEQHISAMAFDRGSNAAGHYRIDKVEVGNQTVSATDIVIPPGSAVKVTVTYAPQNLNVVEASYGGWTTGEAERYLPTRREDLEKKNSGSIYQRAIIETIYDHPNEGIYYVQLIGEAKPGPNGEIATGSGTATCTAGSGTMCYTGGFAIDIPQLAPGGAKPLDISGPIKMTMSDAEVKMRMNDFPLVVYYLRSTEIPKLPSGVTATLVISGGQDTEAIGTFDGSRLELKSVTFRVRVALGELSLDQIKQGISALVDFNMKDLEITTTKPYDQGKITLHMEASLGQNPSGNELFDQFLSGAKILAFMEGELMF